MSLSHKDLLRLSPSARAQILSQLGKVPKENKYHAEKVSLYSPGGIKREFDSKREAKRYFELMLLLGTGKIAGLRRQVDYELIPAQYETYPRYGKNGKRLKDGKRCLEKAVHYKADFVYEMDGETVVEDVKGAKTKDYIIKRKLMLYIHGIKIKEI